MSEEIQKKKMSKGCMVALIVGGVLLVMILVAGVTCYMYKDNLAKFGVSAVVKEIGKYATENPQPGVDTTHLNMIISTFSEKLANDTTDNLENISYAIQKLSNIPKDEMLDSAEAVDFIKVLTEIYPDLSELKVPAVEDVMLDSINMQDSTAIE